MAIVMIAVGRLSSRRLRSRIEQELLQGKYPGDVKSTADIGSLSVIWTKRKNMAELAPSVAVFAVAAKAFAQDMEIIGTVLLVTSIALSLLLRQFASTPLLEADGSIGVPTRRDLRVSKEDLWMIIEVLIVLVSALGTLLLIVA